MDQLIEYFHWLKNALSFRIIDGEKIQITVFNLLIVLVIFIAVRYLLKLVKIVLNNKLIVNGDFDKGGVNSFMQLVKYFTYTLAFILTLETIGIKMSFLLASSAALLVGIGFGLQQVFYDFISGIILLFEGTIKVDDVVQINSLVGRVKYIGLRTSKILTREGTFIIVPNSKFISGDVINWSHIATSTRFSVAVGVAYGSDVRLVEQCLLSVASTHKMIALDPPPFVRFSDFAESSLNFDLFFWTEETFAVENIKSDLRFEIDQIFREKSISIPFPQRDVHFKTPLEQFVPNDKTTNQ